MSIIDYKGFRVLAVSILPGEQENKQLSAKLLTLSFGRFPSAKGYNRLWFVSFSEIRMELTVWLKGSGDSGSTVFNSDEKLAEIMKAAGKQLNLRPHFVGKPPKSMLLHSPVTTIHLNSSVSFLSDLQHNRAI
jgi:hypothetical protein